MIQTRDQTVASTVLYSDPLLRSQLPVNNYRAIDRRNSSSQEWNPEEGRMSPSRRTFCLFTTFDLILTFILWVIYTQLIGKKGYTAFEDQIEKYDFKTSLFDTVMIAAIRFTCILLAYGLFRICHWWVIASTTSMTCIYLLFKCFYFQFNDEFFGGKNPLSYVILIVCFVLAWIETWFLDFKVVPVERKARRHLRETIRSGDREPLLSHSRTEGSVISDTGQFYSPLVTPEDDKRQKSMSSFLTPTKRATDEQITQAIADMVVSDYVPLSIVEGEGFRKLMGVVAPDYKVPCRKTIRSRITRRYDGEKETLTSAMEHVTSAALTTDTWTSNSTESYITVTEHHITDGWELETNVLMTLAMPECHTGENIASRLQDCVSEFNLDGKVETCVHDNARNMESAGNMCEDWSDLGCFGHTLQLCLKPALELPKVAQVVSRCRKLVGHFKHSTTLTAEMGRRQKSMGVKEHALIQDVPTRWNSTYDMMARLSEQRQVITDLLLDPKFTKKGDSALNLLDREWDLLSELCDVLYVFSDVTSYMCTESNVSVSELLPIVCGLVDKRLCSSENDSSTALKVKDTIKAELQRRYQPTSDATASSTSALATLLDPRYKKMPFFTSSQRRTVEDQLESRLDDLPLKQSEPRPDQERPAKRRKLDFLEYDSPNQSANDELQLYLAEKMDPDAEPLDWWRKNEHRFPQVATVARRILAVPATSVPSERIFSAAGLLLNKLRNRLSSELVDNIIFLNKNSVNLDKDCEL